MFSKVKGLIEYYGIADELPVLENPSCFKQLCLHESLPLPDMKPDISRIVKVVSELEILDSRVIRTPKAISLEGQRLTGFKLMVDGALNQKVEYAGESPAQAVHAVHFGIPFSTYIILPESFRPNTNMNISGYLEDVSVTAQDKRNIFVNVILLINVDF